MREKPILFGRHGNLVGVITEPEGKARSSALILGAGIIHRVGPSRAGVRLARRLAAEGCRVLRFDLAGIGDSAPNPETTDLEDSAIGDIEDAIGLMAGDNGRPGVILVGFCSGADNAFYVAAEDERVAEVVLFDPSVERTPGFHRRLRQRRLRSPRSWLNVLSGRSLFLRIRERLSPDPRRPPGFYGLLTVSGDEYRRRAQAGVGRGVRYLYVISGGIERFCNSPEQVEEALGDAFSGDFMTVLARPGMNHILSRREDQDWFAEVIIAWLREGANP